jgi:hypothetical protein
VRKLLAVAAVLVGAGVLVRRLSAGRLHGSPASWPEVPRKTAATA